MGNVKRIDLPTSSLRPQRLRPRAGLRESVHLLDHASIHALNAALIGGRPLLVRGHPGVGKSQLARAAADLLDRAFVAHTVTSRTETDDLLWHVDLVARLAEAQLAGVTQDRAKLDLKHFVCPGPLWWGFNWASAQAQLNDYRQVVAGASSGTLAPDEPSKNGVVVLIDEIDKADSAVPNGLLDALGHRGFSPPGVARVAQAEGPAPLVIFTTNEERHLPDAFLRRCFVHTMRLPEDPDRLIDAFRIRGEAHDRVEGWGLEPTTIAAAAQLVAADRLAKEAGAAYRPGMAEYLDLLRAVQGAADPDGLLDSLATFVLDKQAGPD